MRISDTVYSKWSHNWIWGGCICKILNLQNYHNMQAKSPLKGESFNTYSILQLTYFILTVTAQSSMHRSIRNATFSDHTRVKCKWWKIPAKQTLWRWDSCELDALWFSANRSTHDNSVHHCLTSAQKSPCLYQWGEGSSLAPYLHCWNSVTNNTMRTYESHRTLLSRLWSRRSHYTVQSSSRTEHVCENWTLTQQIHHCKALLTS